MIERVTLDDLKFENQALSKQLQVLDIVRVLLINVD